MKRGIKTLLLLGLFCPLVVNAATVSLDCPNTAKVGTDVTCSIKLNSTEKVAGFEANISASSGLTYKSYTKASGWSGASSSSAFLVYGNEVEGNVTLGTYTYTVGNNASGNLSVTLNNITVSDTNGDPLTSNTTTSDTIRVLSSVDTLSSLTIGGASIEFSPSVTTYNVTIDAASTTISATPTNSYATVTGTGTKNLNYGNNKFEIAVKSELGSTKIYTINVTRPDNRSSDNTLKELKLNNGTINFKSGTTSYNVTVDGATTEISAVANDNKAKVSGTGTKNLNYGVNTFKIVVTAENGSTKTYTLNITRKDNRSSNANLSSITLSDGTLSYDKNKTNYELSVDYEVAEIKIDGKVEDNKSKVEGLGTKQLEVGENTFVIKVTAENGSTKEYKIVIIRNKEEIVTVNNNIKFLSIEGHELEFNANTKHYNIKTDKDSLNIKVELENPLSTYEIIGNEDLEDGSIIQIIVTDQEGNNNIYSITVEKLMVEEKEDINYVPVIMISLLVALLGSLIAVLVIKQRRK